MQILQLLLSGIAQGCIYGLIALGFVLIYKATETVSFAQGELMMLGAFCAFAGMSLFGLPFWLAALLAVAAMVAFGVLVELVVIRPILGQPQFSIVMLTIGIGYVARRHVGGTRAGVAGNDADDVHGSVPGIGLAFDYDARRGMMIVGDPQSNRVTLRQLSVQVLGEGEGAPPGSSEALLVSLDAERKLFV